MTSEALEVWISVGSNHSRKADYVAAAFEAVGAVVENCRFSEPYTTPAVNGKDADYLNAVVYGRYRGTADELTSVCKELERKLGRTRRGDQSAGHVVEIGLDVVVFGGEVLRPVDYARSYFTTGFNQLKEDCRRPDF